jgi:uroporphyrinogen-III synthase
MDISDPKNYFKDKTIAVIGPVTQRALIEHGIEPDIIPSNYSMNFLIDEIKGYYSQNSIEK